MGQCRLHCIVHGVPLPPLGSFEYNVLYEGIRRKKSEKVAFAKFLGALLGPLSDLEPEKIMLLVAEYAEEVYQLKYNWEYQALRTRVVREKQIAHNEDLRILKRVEAMTVTEDITKDG